MPMKCYRCCRLIGTQKQTYRVVWLLLFLLWNIVVLFGSNNNNQNPPTKVLVKASASSSYTSVRALDQFGHSEQLKNAKEASNQHGTLVIAAKYYDPDNKNNNNNNHDYYSTMVLSVLEDDEGLVGRKKHSIPPSNIRLVHYYDDDSNKNNLVGLVCTGVQGDAQWLYEEMCSYCSRVWDRYNTNLDGEGIAVGVSQLLRGFWGYSRKHEWKSPCWDWSRNEYWSRPLGVVTFVLSSRSRLPYFSVLDPSGIIRDYRAYAMGQNSDLVLPALEKEMAAPVWNNQHQEYRNNDDDDNDDNSPRNKNDDENDGSNKQMYTEELLKERLLNMLRSTIASTTNNNSNNNNKKNYKVLVEILSSGRGIQRTIVDL